MSQCGHICLKGSRQTDSFAAYFFGAPPQAFRPARGLSRIDHASDLQFLL
jgi:hypothetical protein